MAQPLHRTLGELRAELQTRLGFGMSGQAGIVNSPLIDSFLRSAQEWLYWSFEWRELSAFEERLTGVDQALYDYPDGCNVERITRVAAWNGVRYVELCEGISLDDRSGIGNGWPTKYERSAQLEVWPVPTSEIKMRIEFIQQLAPFHEAAHRTSLPSEIVFLMALSNAKAHYNQADAQRYEKQLETMLAQLKAKNRGRSVWGDERAMSKDDYYARVR